MFRKRDLEIENVLRREEAKRRRVERVLTGYVKYTHPEIYEEAYQYYNRLDATYPDKKDLRKTPPFLLLKANPDHKTNKAPERVKVHQTVEKTVTDNFVLRIPLMQRKTTAVRETSTTTTNVQETPAPPPSETIVETIVETAAETTTALSPVDDATLEEIMADLREDPNIQNFFDNLDFEIDNCPLW